MFLFYLYWTAYMFALGVRNQCHCYCFSSFLTLCRPLVVYRLQLDDRVHHSTPGQHSLYLQFCLLSPEASPCGELLPLCDSKLLGLLHATLWGQGFSYEGCLHARAQFNLSFHLFHFGVCLCHFLSQFLLQQPSIWSGVVAVISYPSPVSWQPNVVPQATSHQSSCQIFIILDALKITAVISCFSNI